MSVELQLILSFPARLCCAVFAQQQTVYHWQLLATTGNYCEAPTSYGLCFTIYQVGVPYELRMRPRARAMPASHISPRCPRRHSGRRFPTRRAGSGKKALPGTARALPRKAENRKEVEIPTQFLAYPRCCGAYCCTAVCCRCGLVGTHCCTAVVLLWWVGRWVGGGWWVVAARSLPEISGGSYKGEMVKGGYTPRFSGHFGVQRKNARGTRPRSPQTV